VITPSTWLAASSDSPSNGSSVASRNSCTHRSPRRGLLRAPMASGPG
jgi:hypothetical protein